MAAIAVPPLVNGAHARAALFAPDLDFIPTISSDEEDNVPDYDGELSDNELVPVPNQPKVQAKRKRDVGGSGKKDDSKNKKQKLHHKEDGPQNGASQSHTSISGGMENGTDYEDEGETGVDDGAFDPNFEFHPGGVEGGVLTGFDDPWEIPTASESRSTTENIGIDEIVKRRRERKMEADGNDDKNMEIQNEDEDGFTGFEEDEEDELVSHDGFGMGAVPDADADAESSEDNSDSAEATKEDMQGADVSDQDEHDEVAEPVAHPDDVSDDEEEGLTERQAAFFEPEESAANVKSLSASPSSFQNMSLSRPILKGLAAVGFESPTPIQLKTVPVALLGKDVVGGAVTGSGKTAAFIIPILERLLYRPKRVPTTRVSILMPTRELAVQCYNVATRLASFTDISFALIVGGLSLREQEQTLRKRPDIVIATPGRFIDHMRNSASFVIENLEILVLDEADRMLDDGFADELNEVLTTIPKGRQTMLFSATMTQDVDQLIRVGLNRPVRLMVDAKKQTVQGLVQEFIKMKAGKAEVDEERRLAYLLHLCETTYTAKTIIFFPRKALAHRVKVLFTIRGIKAAELHGSMSQEQRLNAIASFREGSCTHLLATDLASRGLDIPRVETVINYTVPPSTTIYLHRVGRTARAGQSGVSCTLFSAAKTGAKAESKSPSERTHMRPILRLARNQGADIRTRSIAAATIDEMTIKVRSLQEEIDSILDEEKEERLLQQSERDVTKGENLVKHEAEIASRPKRTWFQNEKEKTAASKLGKQQMLGISGTQPELKRKEKKKLSGKEKKKLQDKDLRVDGKNAGWKKGKNERGSKGNARPTSKNDQKKKKQKKK